MHQSDTDIRYRADTDSNRWIGAELLKLVLCLHLITDAHTMSCISSMLADHIMFTFYAAVLF